MIRPLELSRRILGALFLGAAVVMVAVGLSVLRERLTGLPFLIYWLICYLFTVLAFGMAVLETLAIRRRAREERQELIRRTFGGPGKPPDDSDPAQISTDPKSQ